MGSTALGPAFPLVVFFSPDCHWNAGVLIWGDAMGPRADADLLPRGQEEPGAAGAAGSTVWLLWNTEPSVWGPGSGAASKGWWEAGRRRGKDGSPYLTGAMCVLRRPQ